MKRQIFKKTSLATAVVLAASIAYEAPIEAAINPSPTASVSAPKTKAPPVATGNMVTERQQQIEHEALEALAGTEHALVALRKSEPQKALALLQDVSGKLDILLAKHPGVGLLPAEIDARVYDFDADVKQVEKIVDAADDLLEDSRVQDARKILNQLISEIRISTLSIPLGSFPAAIKEAVRLIDQGKTKDAEKALNDTLNTLVETVEIMPLPVLKAEELLTQASELEHKSDLTKESSRTEILILADAAKDKLKLAEVLGYGSADDYKQLYDAIDEIKDVIHTEKSAALWNKIKTSFSELKNKLLHPNKT